MKVYKTPEAWLTLLTQDDVLTASDEFFVDEQGNDGDNVMEWWG